MVYTSGPMIYRVNLDGSQAATLLDSSSQDRPNVLGIDFDYRSVENVISGHESMHIFHNDHKLV